MSFGLNYFVPLRYLLSISLLILFSCFTATAGLAQLTYTEYSYRTGVPARNIYFVRQESEGAWLFGTVNGLYRFNGVNFFPYFNRRNVPPAVSHSAMKAGTMAGKKLYLAGTNGRYLYDAEKDIIAASVSISGKPLFFDTLGKKLILIDEEEGLLEIDPVTLQQIKTVETRGAVFVARGPRNTVMLVNKDRQLLSFSLSEGIKVEATLPSSPSEYHISKAGWLVGWTDKNKILWGDTQKTVNQIIKQYYTHLKRTNTELFGHELRDVYQDKYGLLWITTNDGTIKIFNSPIFSSFLINDQSVRCIQEDSKGTLLFSSYTGSYIRKKGENRPIKINAGNTAAWCAIPMNTEKTEFLLPLRKDENYLIEPSTQSVKKCEWVNGRMMILCYASKSADIITVAGRGIGEIDLKKRTVRELIKSDDFPHFIYSIAHLDDQKILMATNMGLQVADLKTGKIKKIHGAECRWIVSIENGEFIAGTLGSGMLRYSNHDQKVSLIRCGILEIDRDFPYSGILSPDKRYIIIGTQRGLYALNIKSNNVYFIPSRMDEYNSSAMFFDREGNLYTGGITGLEIFSNKLLFREKADKSGPFIADIRSYASGLGWINTYAEGMYLIKMMPDYLNTEISLGSARSLVQRTIIYRYRINGYQDSWVNVLGEPGNTPQILLTRLPPGRYLLEFQNQTALGIWSDISKVVLESIPAYYETTWFRLLVVLFSILLVIGLSVILYRRRIRHIKTEATINNLKNRVTHSELTALRSQINPHMFANSLQTLQYYIYNNDKAAATEYLNLYSMLMRSTLEMSSKDLVPLTEKIEYLNRYCQFENMKIGNRVAVNTELRNIDEPESIFMPTMVIQPFVENAFKHGFRNAPDGLKLELKIVLTMENKELVCYISNTATTLRSAENLQRVSGNSITEERLKLYGELFNSAWSVESSYKGHIFEVRIKIPYQKTNIHGRH